MNQPDWRGACAGSRALAIAIMVARPSRRSSRHLLRAFLLVNKFTNAALAAAYI
jgi:hypothetical protein